MELVVPERLTEEFATVHAVWQSEAATRGVDALLLSWIKYEKQLRRLFSFLVFQHPAMSGEKSAEAVGVLVGNDKVYPRHLITAIAKLGVKPVPELIGKTHDALEKEVTRIYGYRNKLMHGQVSGENISTEELEQDVHHLIGWIDALAGGAHAEFGYDGLVRNTCVLANANKIVVQKFPFKDAAGFKTWLDAITQRQQRANAPAQARRA